jgi:3-phosphoshikimate 1-carboxyvinyltransferase
MDATFRMEGRLAKRPLSPLWEEMERMGCALSYLDDNNLRCCGKLRSGEYSIDGSVSSQFISGLLFAAALIPGENKITITGKIESRPYIDMTRNAMEIFGRTSDDFIVSGGMSFISPSEQNVEGDWSNGAFFLAANAFGNDVAVENLSYASLQGDKAAADLIVKLKEHCTICAADIPDLVPILSVVAACNKGAVFTNIQRLRLKESDRVESVIAMLRGLGGNAEATEDTLTVYGTGLTGGSVDSVNDHRIAMSTAIAATACKEPVILYGAHCVEKSYPRFFEEYRRLGGNYEQYLR